MRVDDSWCLGFAAGRFGFGICDCWRFWFSVRLEYPFVILEASEPRSATYQISSFVSDVLTSRIFSMVSPFLTFRISCASSTDIPRVDESFCELPPPAPPALPESATPSGLCRASVM